MAKEKELELKDLTKQELIAVIDCLKRSCIIFNFDCVLERALNDVQYQRKMRNLDKSAEYNKKAKFHLDRYNELIKPYIGKPISCIPTETLKRADMHEQEYLKAQKKSLSLMGVKV